MKKINKKKILVIFLVSVFIFSVGLFTHKINYGNMTVLDTDTDIYSSYSNKQTTLDFGDVIEQELMTTKGSFNSVSLKYHKELFEKGLELNIQLIDKDTGDILNNWIENGSNISDDGFSEYSLDEPLVTHDKLALVITTNMVTDSLCFSETDSIKQSNLTINGISQEGDLIVRETSILYVTATLYWAALYSCLISLLIVTVIFSYKEILHFVNKKLIQIQNNKKQVVKLFLIVLFSGIFSVVLEHFYTMYHLHVGHTVSDFNKYKCLFFFVMTFVLLTLISFGRNIKKAPEKYYFLIFFAIGILFVLSMPAQAEVSWDESIHYWNAISIADSWKGYANSAESYLYWHSGIGGYGIPSTVADLNLKYNYIQNLYNTGHAVDINYSVLTALNALSYLPSAIGINIGKTLHLSMKNTFYLGAMMNMILYLTLGYFSLKKLKSGKMILLTVITLPTAFFLSSVYSYDSWVTGFTMLGISYLIGILQDGKSIVTRKEMLIMILAFALGFLAKAIYFPLFLLYLFIPKERFANKKECKIFRVSAISCCLTYLLEMVLPAKYLIVLFTLFFFLCLVLYTLYRRIPKKYRKTIVILSSIIVIIFFVWAVYFLLPGLVGSGDTRGGNDVNSAAQVKFVLYNPFQYLNILFTYLFGNYLNPSLAFKVNFGTFGYLGESPLYLLSMIFLVIIIFIDKDNVDTWKKYRVFKISTVIISFFTIILIATALYVSFTPVAFYAINGCQPRYLLPLFPGICLSIGTLKNRIKIRKDYLVMATFVFCTLILLTGLWRVVICKYI